MLANQFLNKAVRLIGLGASALMADTTPQLTWLFPRVDPKKGGWESIDRAVDRIAERHGYSAAHRGVLDASG
jgi:hypothetical protein